MIQFVFYLQPTPARSFYRQARPLGPAGRSDMLAAHAVKSGAGGVSLSPRVTAYLEGARQRERIEQEKVKIAILKTTLTKESREKKAKHDKEKEKDRKGGKKR